MKALPFTLSLVATLGIGAAVWFVRSAQTQSLDQELADLKVQTASRLAPSAQSGAGGAPVKRSGRKESAFGAIFDPVDQILATPDDKVADLAKEMFAKRPGENLIGILKLMAIYSRWAEVDPDGALKHILDETNGGRIRDERGVALMGLFSTWMARDANGAFAATAGLPSGQLKNGMMEFMPRYLAFMRPDLTEGWDTAMNSAGVEQKKMDDLQAIKAARDPEQALKELDSVTDPAERAKKTEAILGALAMSNPSRALELAPKLLADSTKMEGGQKWMLTTAMSTVAAKDPDKALEYYLKAPDELKDAYKGSFTSYGSMPAEKILETSGKFNSPQEKKQFLNGAIAGKAESNPAEAARMLGDLPAADRDPSSHYAIGKSYADTDFKAAGQWIEGLPAGDAKDRAILGTLDEVNKDNRVQAAEIIPQIGDEAARTQAATSFAANWMRQDKDGATAWINNSPLFTQDQRFQIISGKSDR